MRRRHLALGGSLLLAGCSGTLLPKPPQPPLRYTLDEGLPLEPAGAPEAGAPVLLVSQPRAAPGCDSTRMVYMRRAAQLEAYANAEWVDTPAQMLAPLMVASLQRGTAFAAVLLAPAVAVAGLRLDTELLRLQQDFGSAPSLLRLSLRAVLIDNGTRKVLAWQAFDMAVPAVSEDSAGGVAAARAATRQMLLALRAFCFSQVARQRAGPA